MESGRKRRGSRRGGRVECLYSRQEAGSNVTMWGGGGGGGFRPSAGLSSTHTKELWLGVTAAGGSE